MSDETQADDSRRLIDVITFLLELDIAKDVSPRRIAGWVDMIYREGCGPLTEAERDDLTRRINLAVHLDRY